MTDGFSLRRLAGGVPADRRRIPLYSQTRRRTVNLRFEHEDDGFRVHAWGDAFPNEGAGAYEGRLRLPAHVVQAAVANLRDTWQRVVIERKEETADSVGFPFVDHWDLRNGNHRLDTIGPKLAQAGHQLFTVLFCRGDDGLSEIEECLENALRHTEQIITIHSGDLFVPWPMLYTPVDDGSPTSDGDGSWSMSGFWGYRHLVEHCFPRATAFDIRIRAAQNRPAAGLNVDPRVDDQYPPTPCVAPVVDFFRSHYDATIRTTSTELHTALAQPDFTDQILYFACHGLVSGEAGGVVGEPWLCLADDEPIRYTDLIAWLPPEPLPTSPVVFVNACQGGQMHSRFYPSFGVALIAAGANCLVGPQIDLPRAFSREYSRRFFESLLAGTRIGDIGRDLTREFADVYRNPLGLIFSLYRGLDTHVFDERTAQAKTRDNNQPTPSYAAPTNVPHAEDPSPRSPHA